MNNNDKQWRQVYFWAQIVLAFRQMERKGKPVAFRLVGERFGITQAAVSHHIKNMESAFGFSILVRKQGSGGRLSEQGMAMIPSLKKIVMAVEKIQQIQPVVIPADIDRE